MARYRFKKVPANLGLVKFDERERLIPDDIYEYARSFRSVYTRSMPMLEKIEDAKWTPHHKIKKQLYGKPQSLAVQIAMSNELLLKAILLGSTGSFKPEHDLKTLINSLDRRYIDIIKEHLKTNGLKDDHWHKVLNMSARTFISARYGYEGNGYVLDFRTLQLLNEALDDIFNNYLPDWTTLTKEQQKDKKELKKEVDLIFDKTNRKEKTDQSFLRGLSE